MNRTTLANGNTQFQDFAACNAHVVGGFVEFPMSIAGAIMGRFEIIAATSDGFMMTFEAKRVA